MKSARYEEKLKKRWRGNIPAEDGDGSKKKNSDTELTLSPLPPSLKTPTDIADINSSPLEKNLVEDSPAPTNKVISPKGNTTQLSINLTNKPISANIDNLTINSKVKQPEPSTHTSSFEYTDIAKKVLEAQISGKSPPPVSYLINPRYAIRNQERRRPGGDLLLSKAFGEKDSFSLSNDNSKVLYNRSLASSNNLSFLNLSFNSINNSLGSGTLKFRDSQSEDSKIRARNFLDPLKNNKAVNSTSVSSGFETPDHNPLEVNPSDSNNYGSSVSFLVRPPEKNETLQEKNGDFSRDDGYEYLSSKIGSLKKNLDTVKEVKDMDSPTFDKEIQNSTINYTNHDETYDLKTLPIALKNLEKKVSPNLSSKSRKRKPSPSNLSKNVLNSISGKKSNLETSNKSKDSSPLSEVPSDQTKSAVGKRKATFRESAKKSKVISEDSVFSSENIVESHQNNKVAQIKGKSKNLNKATSKSSVTKQVFNDEENKDFLKGQSGLSSLTSSESQNKLTDNEINQMSKKVEILLPSNRRPDSSNAAAVRNTSKYKITVPKSILQKTAVTTADDSFSSAHALTPAVPRVRVKTLPRNLNKDSKRKEVEPALSLNLVSESNMESFEDAIMPDMSPVLKKSKLSNANKQAIQKNKKRDLLATIDSKQSQLSYSFDFSKKSSGTFSKDSSVMDIISHELLSHIDFFKNDLIEIKPKFAPLLNELRSSLESNLNKIDSHFCHRAQLHRKLLGQREKQNNLRESLLEYRDRTHNLEAELRKEKELFEQEQTKRLQLESAHELLFDLERLKQLGSKPKKLKKDSKSTPKNLRLVWLGLLADLAVVRSRLGLDPLPLNSSDILDSTQTQALHSQLEEINRQLKDKVLKLSSYA